MRSFPVALAALLLVAPALGQPITPGSGSGGGTTDPTARAQAAAALAAANASITTGVVSGGNLILQNALGATAATVALPAGNPVVSAAVSGSTLVLTKADSTTASVALPAVGNPVVSASVSGSNLVLTKSDSTTATVALPGGNPVVSAAVSGSNLVLTKADNSTSTIALPATTAGNPVVSATVSGNNLVLTKADSTTSTVALPAATGNPVVSAAVSGNNIVLTKADSTTSTLALPTTAVDATARAAAAAAIGVIAGDGSTVTIPVINGATGIATTVTFPSSAFTLPTAATLPTLNILNSGMVANSTPGEAITVLFGVVPGATLSVSSTNGDLSLRGNVVQVASGVSTALNSETLTITESAPGYVTHAFSFSMVSYPPIDGVTINLADWTGGSAPIASDDFSTYPNIWTPSNTSGTYYSTLDDNGNNATNYGDTISRQEPGEAERYTDRGYPAAHPIDPFEVIPGGMIHIMARPKDATISAITGFNTSDIQWTSGLLRVRNSGFTSACWQTRAISTGANAVFAANWLYPPFGIGGTEDDGLGEFSFFPVDFRAQTQYKHGYQLTSPSGLVTMLTVPPILGTGAFHTTTVCHSPQHLSTGIDHKYTSTQPTPANTSGTPDDWLVGGVGGTVNKQFDLIMNLAVRDFTGAGITATAFDTYVDGWKSWAAHDPSTAPPVGAPSWGPFPTVSMTHYGPTQQTLYYTVPSTAGSSATVDVKGVYRVTGTSTWSTPQNGGTAGYMTVNFPGADGVSYDFGLVASNASGSSQVLLVGTYAVPPASVTNAPTVTGVSSAGTYSITVSSENGNTGVAGHNYYVRYGTTGSFTFRDGGSDSPHVEGALGTTTGYVAQFYVTSVTSGGTESPPSNTITYTPATSGGLVAPTITVAPGASGHLLASNTDPNTGFTNLHHNWHLGSSAGSLSIVFSDDDNPLDWGQSATGSTVCFAMSVTATGQTESALSNVVCSTVP